MSTPWISPPRGAPIRMRQAHEPGVLLQGRAETVSGLRAAHRFFAGTASSYDLTVHVWTLGLDRLWKKKILAKIPPVPERMIDQACGTGILTLQMARRYPGCKIVGVDLHRDYITLAARKAGMMGLGNVHWVQGRAEDVVLRGRYDAITSSYLAKYAELDRLVRTCGRMLRTGGVLVMHDFTYPRRRILTHALGLYFRIMRAVGGRTLPEWRIVFNELEDFLRQSRWVSGLISALQRNGFGMIRREELTLGFSTIVSAVKK